MNQIKNKFEKSKNDNKQLNSLINSSQNKKKKLENSLENIIPNKSMKLIHNFSQNHSLNDMEVNEINDENLKEITILMKKILED